MKRSKIWFCALLVLAALGAASPPTPDRLIVHEWGTFLAMNGSDGVTLDGMYHEEHALPAFVHARSRDQLHVPVAGLKGETPVIYFYTGRPQSVNVNVRFPRGIWTQWYPQATFLGPSLTSGGTPPKLHDGHITWKADIIPAQEGETAPKLPNAEKGALWNYAREVDAAYVRTHTYDTDKTDGEWERFLFYRGLGQAGLPLRMTMEDGGTLQSAADAPVLQHLFILRVEKGKGVYRYLPRLVPGESVTEALPALTEAQPLEIFTTNVSQELAARLTESGLYPKEAQAMVNTWRNSYFRSDGIRVLFALPQSWTDKFIPLTITPQPEETVRVMVGRLEVLTPERERQAENAVRDLAAPEEATRERAFAFLREQGRYVEPIIRRTLRTTQEEGVRRRCKRLLLTDFVTELRAASNAAADGRQRADDPLFVRAQLAGVLREVGLNTEAKEVAQRAYAGLQKLPEPDLHSGEARHTLRAYARVMEGLGDDAGAVERYGAFVRYASQAKQCAGCHRSEGPRTMAFFRDWWAGKKFAEYATRAGQTAHLIAQNEAALDKHPNDTAAQLLLAYLYEAKGRQNQAKSLWTRLGALDEKPSQTAHLDKE